MKMPSLQANESENITAYLFSPAVLKHNLLIALVVGCVLSLVNQLDVLMTESFTPVVGLKIFSNFLIPFVVSSVSAALNRPHR